MTNSVNVFDNVHLRKKNPMKTVASAKFTQILNNFYLINIIQSADSIKSSGPIEERTSIQQLRYMNVKILKL